MRGASVKMTRPNPPSPAPFASSVLFEDPPPVQSCLKDAQTLTLVIDMAANYSPNHTWKMVCSQVGRKPNVNFQLKYLPTAAGGGPTGGIFPNSVIAFAPKLYLLNLGSERCTHNYLRAPWEVWAEASKCSIDPQDCLPTQQPNKNKN